MQLNPARGRKPDVVRRRHGGREGVVYAAQPREGTETRQSNSHVPLTSRRWFMQLNPARGRKRGAVAPPQAVGVRFMQLNPARGRKLSMSAMACRSRSWFMQLNPARGRKRYFIDYRLTC